METYTRVAIRHKPSGTYIGRSFNRTTGRMDIAKTMKSALRFEDIADASEWLLNYEFAPHDEHNYEYVTIEYQLIEKEVTPHVRVPESPTEAVSSGGH